MLYGPGWIGTRPPTPRLRQSSIGRSRESSLERSPRNARDRGRERNRSKSRSMSPPGPDIRIGKREIPPMSYSWNVKPARNATPRPRLIDGPKKKKERIKKFAFSHDENEYYEVCGSDLPTSALGDVRF
eukprot:1011799-Rhodomonas_salina.2